MPEATRLAALIEQELPFKVTLVPGSRGIFDVHADGRLVYSKFETDRFPDGPEVLAALKG
ncbi:MAG: Rdx family protein [Candidatus Sericytochromatia bacterium]|nr:Rdx family protein [Candidatus Sericytochromatia bacterium]